MHVRENISGHPFNCLTDKKSSAKTISSQDCFIGHYRLYKFTGHKKEGKQKRLKGKCSQEKSFPTTAKASTKRGAGRSPALFPFFNFCLYMQINSYFQ